jgi:hypothetical protein
MSTLSPKARPAPPSTAQALVTAFMDQTPRTRAFLRACGKLHEGTQREHQHGEVRPVLDALERHGYVFFADGTVWLTAIGKTMRDAFEAVERAAKEVADASP